MGVHAEGPYEGFSNDGPRLFAELDRILAQPDGLQTLFDEFGRRAVCDAIMSEEPPLSSATVAEFQASLNGFLESRPHMSHQKFEFTMKLLRDDQSGSQ